MASQHLLLQALAFVILVVLQTSAAPNFSSFLDLPDLKFGDPCSYEAEEIRLNFSANYLNTNLTLRQKIDLYEDFSSKLARLGEGLCNALELNVCNKATLKCDCGEPGSVLAQPEMYPIFYTLEEDDEGKKKCRYAEGAYCIPKDFAPLTIGETKCVRGTSCISKETKGNCSIYATGSNNYTSVQKFLDDMVSGNICSCQTNNSNEISFVSLSAEDLEGDGDENNEMDNNIDNGDYRRYEYTLERRKRDVSGKTEDIVLPWMGVVQSMGLL